MEKRSTKELTATVEAIVREKDTAASFGANFPAAASTPFVLGLAEVASHRAVMATLTPGEITVGVRAEIEHLLPSRVGSKLVVYSVLTRRVKRRLYFRVDVSEGSDLVARVRHVRAVTSLDRIQSLLDRG